MKMSLYFDGGSKGNPGKGYGSYQIETDTGFKAAGQEVEFGDDLTCNEAEYLSLLAALKTALQNWPMPAATPLRVYSDSKLVVEQVKGRWKCKKQHLRQLRDEAVELLNQFKEWQIDWHSRRNSVARFGH